MRERLTTDAGGAHYFCDTDSTATIATEEGGAIPCPRSDDHPAATWTSDGQPAVRALSWASDDAIRRRFNDLNPYDRELVPELWKLEPENFHDGERRQLYAYGISAKRYTLHHRDELDEAVLTQEDGTNALIKPSEHGLGALLNPTNPEDLHDLASEAWRYVLTDFSQTSEPPPQWLSKPAMRKETISTPHVWRAFDVYNHGKTYSEQIKPFSFMMSPTIGRGRLAAPARFVAPYDRDPTTWRDHDYTDIYTGNTATGQLLIEWATLDTFLRRWRNNPENAALDPTGETCGSDTLGLLSRRTIRSAAGLVTVIGKEAGAVETDDEPAEDQASTHLTMYPRADRAWRVLGKAVRLLGVARVAASAGMSERGLRKSLDPRTHPRTSTVEAVARAVAELARDDLGISLRDDLLVVSTYAAVMAVRTST